MRPNFYQLYEEVYDARKACGWTKPILSILALNLIGATNDGCINEYLKQIPQRAESLEEWNVMVEILYSEEWSDLKWGWFNWLAQLETHANQFSYTDEDGAAHTTRRIDWNYVLDEDKMNDDDGVGFFVDQNGLTVYDGGVYGIDENGGLYDIEPLVPFRPSEY